MTSCDGRSLLLWDLETSIPIWQRALSSNDVAYIGAGSLASTPSAVTSSVDVLLGVSSLGELELFDPRGLFLIFSSILRIL